MLKTLFALAFATLARAADVRIVSLDGGAGVNLEGYDIVELKASDDDGLLDRRPELKLYTRLERGLGPGPDRSLLTRLTALERTIEPFTCRPYGVLYVRLKTTAGALDVYAAQLAQDQRDAPCREQRLAQAFELAEVVERRSRRRPFLLLGRAHGPQDDAYLLLTELLALTDVGSAGRLFVPEAAARWARAETAAGLGVDARVDLRLLTAVPRVDPKRRAAALQAVQTSIDRQISASLKRERFAWIPVYGLALSLRQQRLREKLDSLRVRVETARVRALEKH